MDHSSTISVGSDGYATVSETDAALPQSGPQPGFPVVTGDGEACRLSFQCRMLKVERNVGNLICNISIPAAFYDGVALVVGDGLYCVRLVNRDPGLTMNIGDLPDLGAALDLRDDLARQLKLPAMMISRDGEISSDETRLGGLIVRNQGDRRGSMAARRRPRFLARRKGGHGRSGERLHGREIIARD